MSNTIDQPIRSIKLSKNREIRSPKKEIIAAIKKNLAPLPNKENKINPIKLIPVIPAAIVKILYGIGEIPAKRTAHRPHSSNQAFEI